MTLQKQESKTINSEIGSMSARKNIVKLWLVVSILLVGGLLVRSWWQSKQIEDLEALVQVSALHQQLKVPAEVIYYDGSTVTEIAKLRCDLYAKYGMKTFLPYSNVRYPSSTGVYRNSDKPFSKEYPADDYIHVANGSFECDQHNSVRQVCALLVREIQSAKGAGGYLKRHPEEFDRLIRPLLVRLLDSYHPWLRIQACEPLFEMGERDPRIEEVLAITMADPIAWEQCDRVREDYSLDIPQAPKPTNYEYDQDHADWQRVHKIVGQLTTDFPVTANVVTP